MPRNRNRNRRQRDRRQRRETTSVGFLGLGQRGQTRRRQRRERDRARVRDETVRAGGNVLVLPTGPGRGRDGRVNPAHPGGVVGGRKKPRRRGKRKRKPWMGGSRGGRGQHDTSDDWGIPSPDAGGGGAGGGAGNLPPEMDEWLSDDAALEPDAGFLDSMPNWAPWGLAAAGLLAYMALAGKKTRKG